ncbi:hypothetical protein ACLBKU_13420 [Erythrobacter sp. NE805]|uniref:hypothetical protein n=1 Tax=Erythrobacter sp. NE805 TaxID=3389875 RepID=UPI00396B457B
MNIATRKTSPAPRRPMTPIARALVAAAAGLAMTGCTSLSVIPDRVVSAQPRMALSGTPYALPMLQYEVEATRILSACPQPIAIAGHPKDGQFWTGQLAVELGATAKPTQIAGERYLIDHSKLDSFLKTTSFAIEYQPGTEILKGINVSIADQSGEVAGTLLKAGLTVAAVAAGPAGLAAIPAVLPVGDKKRSEFSVLAKGLKLDLSRYATDAAAQKAVEDEQSRLRNTLADLVEASASREARAVIVCQPSVREDVVRRAAIGEELSGLNAKLKAANGVLERRTKLAEAGGLNSAGREALRQELEDVLLQQALIEARTEELGKIEKRLAAKATAVWPGKFDERAIVGLAPLSQTDQARIEGLVTVESRRMVDQQALAKAIAASPDREALRGFAKDFVERYIDRDGRARTFEEVVSPDACSKAGSLDVPGCIAGLTKLAATLDAVATDNLPACPEGAKLDAECLRTLASDASLAKDDFPRQVDGRGTSAQQGLFIRPPARGTLTICRAEFGKNGPGNTSKCAKDSPDLVKDEKVLVPQLGQLRFVRLRNEMFSNNGLSLSLSKEGAVEKFQYASSSTLAKTLADAASQGAGFYKQRQDELRANRDETARLQKEIAYEEAKKKLDGLTADPVPDPMKAIARAKAEAEVELLRAQIAEINARIAGRSAP